MKRACLFLLLAACGTPSSTPRPDGSMPEIDAHVREDAGPSWARYGCELLPWCLEHHDGWGAEVRLCPATLATFDDVDSGNGGMRLASCRHWMRCGDCWACRDWSSHPSQVMPPDVGPSEPECTMPLCRPRFEGDAGSGDAGPSPYELVCSDAG